MYRRVYYFVSRNLASFCKDTRKVMLAWKTTKENEPVNPQLCKHPPWLCNKILFLTFKDLCFDMISTLCLCSKLNWFLKTDGPYGFKNPCYIKENRSQLFCCRLSAPCVQSEVCRGELGRGGKPCGVTDGKGRGCSWRVLLVCGCPCCGSRKCLARALGKGGREGAQEVALGCDPARLWTCALLAVPVFSRCISGCLLGRAWEWCIAVP